MKRTFSEENCIAICIFQLFPYHNLISYDHRLRIIIYDCQNLIIQYANGTILIFYYYRINIRHISEASRKNGFSSIIFYYRCFNSKIQSIHIYIYNITVYIARTVSHDVSARISFIHFILLNIIIIFVFFFLRHFSQTDIIYIYI